MHTDANGYYSLTGSQYPYVSGQVWVSALGYYSAQNLSFSSAPSVIDVPLLPGGPALRGTVRDEATGLPIAGANVAYNGSNTFNFSTTVRSTTTDAQGEWVLDSAEFSEAAAAQGTQGTLQLSRLGYLPASASVNATPPFPFVRDVNLVSANQVILQGAVTDRGTGQPIVGARIIVYGGTLATVHTDASGHYSITGNQYPYTSGQVWVSAAGYYSAQSLSFSNAPSVIDVPLLPGGPVLRGTVRDEATGLPIAGANVAYNGSNTFNFSTTVRSTTTDAQGEWVLDSAEFSEAAAAQGTQGTLQLSRLGYLPASASVNATPPFPFVRDVNLVSANQVILQGAVTDRGTGQPIVGARDHRVRAAPWRLCTPTRVGITRSRATSIRTRAARSGCRHWAITRHRIYRSATRRQSSTFRCFPARRSCAERFATRPLACPSPAPTLLITDRTPSTSARPCEGTTTDLTGHYAIDSSEFAEAAASNGTQGNLSVTASPGYFGGSASVAASVPFPHAADFALVPTGATVDVIVQTSIAAGSFEVDGVSYLVTPSL